MFLEEDHYVSQDFLYVLKLMQSEAVKLCTECKMFAVGNHLDPKVYETRKADHVRFQIPIFRFNEANLKYSNQFLSITFLWYDLGKCFTMGTQYGIRIQSKCI